VTADQAFGCVAIVAMMLLVVNRMARDRMPRHKMLRMALIWVVIIALIVAIGFATQSGG
jgi:hypothetical protein